MSRDPIDQSDFMRLFVRHERDLRVFARGCCRTGRRWMMCSRSQRGDVEEAASAGKGEDFLNWARVIVRYEALRARRNAARDRLVLSEETLNLLADEATDITGGDLEQERAALNSCLQKMGDEQRDLVFAASMRDGGVKELAEATNRTANSLYKLIGRLRASLRDCVDRELEAHG